MTNNHYKRQKQGRRCRTYILVLTILLVCAAILFAVIILTFSGSANDDPTFWKMNNIMSSFPDDSVNASHGYAESENPISADVSAANACVINADSGSLLFEKNIHERIAPASTAKMLTALTVLEYCAPEDSVTVGTEITMIAEDSSRAWLYEGDTLTIRQLLVALLLPSGNDAAYALAVHTGKNITRDEGMAYQQYIDVFINAMNEMALSTGAVSSNFLTPDGYDTQGQYTTAYDMSQIARACLNSTCLAEIMGCYSVYERWLGGREVTYNNTNELLNPESAFYYPKAIGMKTGNSGEAGACLVSAAIINSKTYICVIMGASEDTRFPDSINLYKEIENS